MTVVVDASALIALVANEPEGAAVADCLASWVDADEEIHAPALARYEVANGLARHAAARRLSHDELVEAWEVLDRLPVSYHPLEDGVSAVEVALTLQRRSAYDAAYVALAQALAGELWTLDSPLVHNAESVGLPVRLVDTQTH